MAYDARSGASADVVALLRGADQIVVGLKDRQTAVIQATRSGAIEYVVVPAQVHPTPGALPEREQPLRIANAQRDLYWRNAMDHVRVGDVVTVEWSVGWAQVRFNLAHKGLFLIDTRQTIFPLGATTTPRRHRVGEPVIVRAQA
jgi:hypothetical protein